MAKWTDLFGKFMTHSSAFAIICLLWNIWQLAGWFYFSEPYLVRTDCPKEKVDLKNKFRCMGKKIGCKNCSEHNESFKVLFQIIVIFTGAGSWKKKLPAYRRYRIFFLFIKLFHFLASSELLICMLIKFTLKLKNDEKRNLNCEYFY